VATSPNPFGGKYFESHRSPGENGQAGVNAVTAG
jgi:hypothetical protein